MKKRQKRCLKYKFYDLELYKIMVDELPGAMASSYSLEE